MVTYTKAQIAAASASPIYKPSYDSTDATLYNLMNSTSDDVVDQYTRTFMSLPTSNPYSGVIENPHYCDINDMNSSMSDLKDSLTNAYQTGSDDSGTPNINNPDWISNMDPSNTSGFYYQTFGDPFNGSGSPSTTDTSFTGDDIINGGDSYTSTSGINLISDQTNRLVSNLPTILGIIQAALGIASSLGSLLNPCLGTSNFLSSLLDEGKQIISDIKSKITSAINYIKEKINAGLNLVISEVNSLLNDIKTYVKKGIDLITSEVKKLVQALISSVKMNITNFLKDLNLDPCASFIMKTVTTGAAAYALGSLT